MSTEKWRVRHPGIGTLAYDSEQEARVAAGTAGEVLAPAVQDTDRLREVAADALAIFDTTVELIDLDEDDQPRYLDQADAILAAVLPVHREMVGREIFNALSEEIAWQREKYGDGTDKVATGRMVGMADAAITVRRLAVSAPPTPPGSPPADERATAVEKGRAEPERGCPQVVWDGPYSYRCNLGGAGWVCAKHGRFGPPAPPVAVPGTGDDPQHELVPPVDVPTQPAEPLVPAWNVTACRDRDGNTWEHGPGDVWRIYSDRTEPPLTLDELGAQRGPLAPHVVDNVPALLADHARLTLDLQARDIAVREADGLRAQVEAERDEWKAKVEVLMLGDKALSSRIWLGEECARLRVDRATARAERDRLAETIRRYESVIEKAQAWRVWLADELDNDTAEDALASAVDALDIPSPTAPEAPASWPGLPTPGLHLVDPKYMNRCLKCGKLAGPWTCPGAPAEPEGTPDAR
jgi:hypothetical protein